ncbi:MAG: hypothetical protein ACRDLF_03725 [Solirubrobacteraceae bacterium]
MVAARTNTKIDNNHDNSSPPPERIAIVRWAAGLGAVTAEAVAEHLGVGVASARARLGAAERELLLKRCGPLTGRPALYTVTRAGLRAAGVHGLDPCHVSASNALHLIECARAASALERCYPDHRVQGERELRSEEHECGRALASAELGGGARRGLRDASRLRHRPDLVLWPTGLAGGLPVAVEVELTVKAPERLAAICLAWARARCVAGVLYLAPPEVERAVRRAIDRAHAHERVVVVPLEALPGGGRPLD